MQKGNDEEQNNGANVVLGAGARKLFNKLVYDLKSKLPEKERVYDKSDNASLIYNLFNGGYSYSYKQYKEVFDYLTACT